MLNDINSVLILFKACNSSKHLKTANNSIFFIDFDIEDWSKETFLPYYAYFILKNIKNNCAVYGEDTVNVWMCQKFEVLCQRFLTEWCSKVMVDCNQIKTWKYSTLYDAGDNQQVQNIKIKCSKIIYTSFVMLVTLICSFNIS